MQTYRAAPSASMLIESMRDIGYSLETALADVVDNAISANATRIELFADADSGRIGILDNGTGMNGIEAQTAVLSAGGNFWRDVRDWGAARKLLSPTELGVLETASQVPLKIPSEKQSAVVVNALRRLQTEGCQLSFET